MIRTSRRRSALAGAAVAALSLAVVWTTAPADADEPPVFELPPFPSEEGVLRLHLGASDYFRYDDSDGAGGFTAGTAENLVVNGCNVVAPLPTLATLTPTPSGGPQQGKLGLVGDALGVQVKGEGNGTPCGQVNGLAQAIDLRLGNFPGTSQPMTMDFAELDIEAKFGATVRAELYRGTTLVGTETLPSAGPDSGPDSADGDNFRWRLPSNPSSAPVFFDRIRLSVDPSTPTGAFSLEGGGDGTAPGTFGATLPTDQSDSVFHITAFDGVLGCGQTATENGTGGAPSVSVTLVNQTGCQAVPYYLATSNEGGVQAIVFQKLGGTSNVYLTTVTWPVEAAAYPMPPTQIRYPGGEPHTLELCDGTYANPVPPSPTEPWCLRKTTATVAGTDLMQVVEELFGQGDPGAWR